MAKDVTLADIAARVGVSNVAVSKALSGKPGVSEELRERIKEVAARMGYVSSTSTKSSANETGNIGGHHSGKHIRRCRYLLWAALRKGGSGII